MGVTHVTIQMYGYTFNLLIFICDLGEIDCIFGLDAGKEADFVTYARTGWIWFNANQHDEPKQLSRSNNNAICHHRSVQRIELKLFKDTTIEVAYAKRAMSKRWNGSQVLSITHYVELDFVSSTSNQLLSSQVRSWRQQ